MDLGLHFDQFPVFYSSLTVNTVNKYTFESLFCLSLSLSISGTMNYLTTEPSGGGQTKSSESVVFVTIMGTFLEPPSVCLEKF